MTKQLVTTINIYLFSLNGKFPGNANVLQTSYKYLCTLASQGTKGELVARKKLTNIIKLVTQSQPPKKQQQQQKQTERIP